MTSQTPADAGKVAPETLALRARPQPVTRINRRILIGIAAVILFFLSGLVLVALKPPSLRLGGEPELFGLEHKPFTDALAKLPASYEGLRAAKRDDEPPTKLIAGLPRGTLALNGAEDADAAEKARGSRQAGQARESPVFFRLLAKGSEAGAPSRAEAVPPSMPRAPAGPLSLVSALAAGDA